MEATTQVEILANLRRSFKKHLLEHGKGIAEANVICNDAFFLANANSKPRRGSHTVSFLISPLRAKATLPSAKKESLSL